MNKYNLNIITIYCDGVFDLFHMGHLNSLKKIKNYFNKPTYLIVGVISDEISTTYKRKPIFDENKREKILESCIYVDKTIITDMLIITEEFLNNNNIDFVMHGFSNKNDITTQDNFFEIPKKLNKFIEVPYTLGISTTQIIKEANLKNLLLTDSNDKIFFKQDILIKTIISTLNLNNKHKIIEIAFNTDFLTEYFRDYDYIGVHNSRQIVNKYLNELNNIVLNFKQTEPIFKNKFFDFCIYNCMFNNYEELDKTIKEIERITVRGIFITIISDDKLKCLVLSKTYLIDKGYNIIEYENNIYYSAYKLY